MQLFGHNFRHGLFLAPMAGVADLAFRELCAENGAEGTVTEMISAKALVYGDKKTAQLMRLSEKSGVRGIQLFGHDPRDLSRAAAIAAELEPDFIDLNFGCPAPKIVKSGDGSAVMRNPELIGELTRAVAESVSVPVTVKLRAGYDEKNAPLCAHMAERGGAAAIFVHGRTREMFYRPPVDLEIIKQVKESVSAPVIGNGDVTGYESFCNMRAVTGCDAVMIGRAALGNPFVFAGIAAALEGRGYEPPALALRLETARRHILKIVEYKGEKTGILQARKHLSWYLKGVQGGSRYRDMAHRVASVSELEELIDEIFKEKGG